MPAFEAFRNAFGRLIGPEPDLVCLPVWLAQACAEALPVDGAGISTVHGTNGLRVPLGASDGDSTEVEALQVTIGEGPCLAAAGRSEPVTASWPEIERRWPIFADALSTRSPFRSVASVPLQAHGESWGALDFYAFEPDGTSDLPISAYTEIGPAVSTILLGALLVDSPNEEDMPWLDTEPAKARFRVWQAVGMVIGAHHLQHPTALAMLSGWAYAQGLSLDQVAADLIEGRLDVAALTA